MINSGMDRTQNRVSTGLKVNGALDDASNFSFAQGLRAELRTLGAVKSGIANSVGVGKVAIAGATGVSNLLADIRAKLTELSNEGITTAQRNILQNDYNQMLSQAASVVANAVFNNINLIESGSTNINTLSNLNGGTLSLTAQSLSPLITSLAGSTFATSTNSQSVISNLFTNLESLVNSALGSLVAEVRAMDLQSSFLTEISDTMEEGLGNIVDADMARESAKLTSLQVQQQLSIQTLGIANQRPQFVLGLFRG